MSQSPSNNQQLSETCPVLTPELLQSWPLPELEGGSDKESRGRILIVGGSWEMPGAAMLAATAALRAGAGKLRIAVGSSLATAVAVAIPEARVYRLPETEEGGIAVRAAEQIAELANQVQTMVIGPGMIEPDLVAELVLQVLPRLKNPSVILDAAAMDAVAVQTDCLKPLNGSAILTPHAGEMAHLLKISKDEVMADPLALARRAASEIGAVVALKGSQTFLSDPSGKAYSNTAGNVGLATSGSGDTLAGIIGGLAARGAAPLQAAAWGIYLHAAAGDLLAERMGLLGFLARELLDEIPGLMHRLTQAGAESSPSNKENP